jgi:hypothetical protein
MTPKFRLGSTPEGSYYGSLQTEPLKHFNYFLEYLIEFYRKFVRSWSFIMLHLEDCLPDFLHSKR